MPPAAKPKAVASKPMKVAPKAPPKPKAKADDRPILYPVLMVNGVPIPESALVIDEKKAVQLLGWENEEEYSTRLTKADPKLKAAKAVYGDDFLLVDMDKLKVRCWNNSRNRPFDLKHCLKLAQDHLNGHFVMNCETIIISKHGDTDSGQHRLISLKLACEIWKKAPKGTYPAWPDSPPVMRSLVAFGAEDTPEVLRTLDNVKPRSLSDVFYTSPLFEKLSPPERKECSLMMDYAVDLLWKRLGMGKVGGQEVHQTHSASMEFVDNHPGIKKALRHVFDENRGAANDDRNISVLKVSVGHVVAMMYLMAASGNEEKAEEYLASYPRTEKKLDLGLWDKAADFVSELAKGKDGMLTEAIEVLMALVDPDSTEMMQGRNIEKLAVLSAAWIAWRDKNEVGPEDVDLTEHYLKDETTGAVTFVNEPTVGGIDKGSGKAGADAKVDKAEVERAKEQARQERAAALDAKAKGKVPTAGAVISPTQAMANELTAQFKTIADANPGILIMIKSNLGNYTAWLDDAKVVAEAAHDKPKEHQASKLPQYPVPHKDFDAICGRLQRAGHKVGIAVYNPETKVYDVTQVPEAEEKPPVELKADMNKPNPNPKPKIAGTPPKAALRGGTSS
jgi:hypothetical protein